MNSDTFTHRRTTPRIFDPPVLVRTEDDLNAFLDRVEDTGLEDTCVKRRPNTEWRLHAVTNITLYAYKLLGASIMGCPDSLLPERIKHLRSILTLSMNRWSAKPFADRLCFFRCLAVHRACRCANGKCYCRYALERLTSGLFDEYLTARGMTRREFNGIDEKDLLFAEKLFDVTINIFQLNADDDSATLIWRSETKRATLMNLLLYNNHFCYVKNVQALCNSFSCPGCGACLRECIHFTDTGAKRLRL